MAIIESLFDRLFNCLLFEAFILVMLFRITEKYLTVCSGSGHNKRILYLFQREQNNLSNGNIVIPMLFIAVLFCYYLENHASKDSF